MITFIQWHSEDAGETVSTYYNDELLQSRVKSKSLAVVNKPDMTLNRAERNFLGPRPKKRHSYRVNRDRPEEI